MYSNILIKAGSLASPEVGVARKIFQTYFFGVGGASAILEYSVQSLTGLKQTGSNAQRSAITRRKRARERRYKFNG